MLSEGRTENREPDAGGIRAESGTASALGGGTGASPALCPAGGRAVRPGCLPVWKLKEFAALCEQYGWQMREVRAGLVVRMARLFKRRCMLGASVMLCVVLVWLFLGNDLKIEIEHAGENIAEVRRCLKAEGVRVGRLKRRVSTDELKDALALAVPGLAHAAARFEGSILVIDCHGARLGEQAGVAGEGSDIVAAQSGIIVRISAESGTPQVTAGQAVRKGQVLIRGQERTGGGGTRCAGRRGRLSRGCLCGATRV